MLTVPVPRDINLPMPLPHGVLVVLLVFSFLLHILFVNLMLGATLLTLWYQLRGLWNKKYDELAKQITATITVNKSLAVVLGVAPLLTINVLYTIYFYSANALTGLMWIAIIPWVSIVFLFLYAHKYTWVRLENNKALHISLLVIPVLSFLFIPLIFLTNINLMLFPEKWDSIHGFLSALQLPNVFSRYFHFITASLAVTGLFLVWYTGKRKNAAENAPSQLTQNELVRNFYNITFTATLAQFIFGPVVFLTLPAKGIDWNVFWVIAAGVSVAIASLVVLWKEINDNVPGRRFYLVSILLLAVVGFMGTGRHLFRANALKTHQQMVVERTSAHAALVEEAKKNTYVTAEDSNTTKPDGAVLFENNCSVCHHAVNRLVGPPMNEVVDIYSNDPEKLKAWIVKPGRKRMDYPAMIGFPQLSDEELNLLADYILKD